jgi:dihydrolipoamide dehydrogenase
MATVVAQLRQGVEGILSHSNITLVREKGVFMDAHTVGDYTADNIIIATGSETKWLPIKGVDDPRVVDSTGLLQLETLPKRLAIIGAGVIGMEFASVFHRFGSEVTVIEYLKECLPALDSDIAKRLRKLLEKRGITFKMKTAVENVADIDADVILMATGRKPRTEGLNLETLGITLTPQGAIPVDDNYQLSIINSQLNGLYAIGDVNGRQMLAHAAEMQAVRAVNHILGKPDGIRFDIMPAAIFTTPEAACVGPTEDQLKEQGIAYECRKSFWRANGKALAMAETEGMLKLFVTPPSEGQGGGSILGCHAYGAHAADIVQEVSVLMCRDTTVSQLCDMVHIHPTLSEILKNAVD